MSTERITFMRHHNGADYYDLDNESGETVGIVTASQNDQTVTLTIDPWATFLVVEVEGVGSIRFTPSEAMMTLLSGHSQNGFCSECGGRWGSVSDPLISEQDTEIHQGCKEAIERSA